MDFLASSGIAGVDFSITSNSSACNRNAWRRAFFAWKKAQTFDAACKVRPKLPALDTPANCKYEVVKPISIADYYPAASQEADEEGPVVVEFTLTGKAARPTERARDSDFLQREGGIY